MIGHKEELGALLAAHRKRLDISQYDLAAKCKVSRTTVALLEQGRRLPNPEILERVARFLSVPSEFWEPFTLQESLQRFEFEEAMAELVGTRVGLTQVGTEAQRAVEDQVNELFGGAGLTDDQAYDTLNSILVYYGVPRVSCSFFSKYLTAAAFSSMSKFTEAIVAYQKDAIRLFSTFREGYRELNSAKDLDAVLKPLQPLLPSELSGFYNRSAWKLIDSIPDSRLPDLGYISAARVAKESSERQALSSFLRDVGQRIEVEGPTALGEFPEKTLRRMDSLLRKFNTSLSHSLFSPLFTPDPDALAREAERLSPKSEQELAQMAETQGIALRNLANYITADHLDVYVATSMRTDADFVSVNHFVRSLFAHDKVKPFKLRHFNPTQSWIEDRIAKGLVEALMLRRSAVTIYMAQKSDTFGKDSEASVALGQGKPVIVYVPKFTLADLDVEELAKKSRKDLIGLLNSRNESLTEDVDESIDDEALLARYLSEVIGALPSDQLLKAVQRHWADFDLYSEADRVESGRRSTYRQWLDTIVAARSRPVPREIRDEVVSILVANAIRFENRAKVFREIHPLALQVILSSGVLNGILVVRSVEQCAQVLEAVFKNDLDLRLQVDELNYRLVEGITKSTVRVISRNVLLRNAFEAQYERERILRAP